MMTDFGYWMLEKEVDGIYAAKRIGNQVKEGVKNFFVDEEGDTNIISIILILVVVIALAVAFRKNIADLADGIWKKIFSSAGSSKTGTATDQNGGFLD